MQGKTFIENPIFICGHRRSGTTLLTCLLENHPEFLVYPPDSGFFYAYYPIYEDPKYSDRERIEQIVNFCIKNLDDFLKESFPESVRQEINFPLDAFRNEFCNLAKKTKCKPKDLLMSLILAYKNQYGYPDNPKFWVEKTTSSEIYAAEALKWFPRAKFIHVLRDPRDNWASLKSGWDKRFKYHNDSLDRLMHSMIERGKFGFELSIKNQNRFGKDKYKIIKYEDLVEKTISVMTDISEFIGVSFSDNILTPTICGESWHGNNYGDTKFKGPSSLNVNRWRERITDQEAMLIEYHFDEYMKKYDYPLVFKLEDKIDAAVKHYKWYNYAQHYSFSDTQNINVSKKEADENV